MVAVSLSATQVKGHSYTLLSFRVTAVASGQSVIHMVIGRHYLTQLVTYFSILVWF